MSQPGDITLEARNIHVAFGGIHALSGVDLTVSRGIVQGLIGPNGAGKTTLVNVLSGFQSPTRGHVILKDRDVSQDGPQKMARAGVGRSFQAARLFQDLTVSQNLMTAAIGTGLGMAAARERSESVLEWMELSHLAEQMGGSLSYGDERRISIARALALNPHFLLLDEPASGMNDAECQTLMRLIRDIPARFECGVLLIEHNMEVIMGVCQRVHVLDGGRSLAEGSPQEVQNNPDVRRAYLGDDAGNEAA
ncbi:MAG: ABC transporter ATP-binding protein [Rhizobiaceae bacterium]|jgi:branched-chain amino acid transport system ATP-binding protein|nr:ABC transporter ATP-binding protein [Rhizobiaceae bacterium]